MRPTQALQVLRYRNLRLTVKDTNKGFYKGNRTGAMGRHTKFGGYVIDWDKVRTYVVPDLQHCKLTPFVTEQMQPTRGDYKNSVGEGPHDPFYYVEQWKAENGTD